MHSNLHGMRRANLWPRGNPTLSQPRRSISDMQAHSLADRGTAVNAHLSADPRYDFSGLGAENAGRHASKAQALHFVLFQRRQVPH